MGDKNLLIVRFDDTNLLNEWKKIWLNEYGLGATKKRIQELIKEDVSKFREKKDKPYKAK